MGLAQFHRPFGDLLNDPNRLRLGFAHAYHGRSKPKKGFYRATNMSKISRQFTRELKIVKFATTPKNYDLRMSIDAINPQKVEESERRKSRIFSNEGGG